MKRKFITLEIYASDKDIEEVEMYVNGLIGNIEDYYVVADGTLEVKIRENYISLYRQLQKTENKEIK